MSHRGALQSPGPGAQRDADVELVDRLRAGDERAFVILLERHALLLGQALAGHKLFGAAVPTSVLQFFFPRVELHLAYNAAVSLPLGVAVSLFFARP